MAKEETYDGGPELGEVHVTIEVVRGPGHPALTKLLAATWVRVGLAFLGLVAAVAAGTMIVAGPGTPPSRAAGRSPGLQSPQLADPDAVATPFGIRVHCLRLTVVSPGGKYARVDFERATPCGTYGNYVTLILHRVHGTWVREFEATGWRCPTTWLPPSVLAGLRICREPVTPARPLAPPPRSP